MQSVLQAVPVADCAIVPLGEILKKIFEKMNFEYAQN